MTVALRCPVCRAALGPADRTFRCAAGHSFDRAADGHLNLLLSHQRRSREPGDSKEMVRSRRAFLDAGHYDVLIAAVAAAVGRVADGTGLVVDAGCGEGSYTRAVTSALPAEVDVVGVDVSKPAIVAAAKRDKRTLYVVASAFDLPVLDGTADVIVSNFAPVDGAEFARALTPAGHVVTVHPGPDHLFALRRLVYDRPEPHVPKPPLRHHPELFEPVATERVTAPVCLRGPGTVTDLLAMTPYWWQADTTKQARIAALAALDTDLDCLITVYRRRPPSEL